MSGASSPLPPGFEALEPFLESWAVHGAANREQRRSASSEPERVAFYEVAKELLPAALDYLDRKPLNQFDEREKRLMNLLLGLCHVAVAVEAQADHEVRHAQLRRHLRITRASADRNC